MDDGLAAANEVVADDAVVVDDATAADAPPARRPRRDVRPELPERISEGRPSSVEAADQALVRKPQIGDTRPAPARPPAVPAEPAAVRPRRQPKPKASPCTRRGRASRIGQAAPSRRDDRIRGARCRGAGAPSRSGAQRPADRSLPDVRAGPPDVDPGRRAGGSHADRALRQPSGRRRHPDPREHLPRPGAERAAGDGGRVRRHRHAEERRAVPRRRAVRRRGHRREGRQPAHRADCSRPSS